MTDNSEKRVLAAMSGGVDSSAAVKLLLDGGYVCGGAIMKLVSDEESDAVRDARLAADKLGIDFYVFDFSAEFKEKVMDSFVNTYLSGGTPNPCVECNKHLKFGRFLDKARELGYEYIATGHYVTKEYCDKTGRWLLKRAADRAKDQSYVLYSLTQDQLAHTIFPAGEKSKNEIRGIVAADGLADPSKPESQDICFIPDGKYADFIIRRSGEQKKGEIRLSDGTYLGEHKGLINYTVGQRKGIGISYREPLFVIEKNIPENILVMGTKDELVCDSLIAGDVNYIPFDMPDKPFECTAQTRYHQREAECTVYPLENRCARVEFHAPHTAVSKGQAVVFYDGDYVIGGGTILR